MKKRHLEIVVGFALLCALYELCDLFVKLVGLPFPGALLAMLILFLLLSFNILPLRFVEEACKTLLYHMPLYFVPIMVGLVAYKKMLSSNALGIFGAVMVSIVITLVSSGVLVQKIQDYRLKRLEESERKERGENV